MTEPISDSEAFYIGIDPDSNKSGVAIWRHSDRRYNLYNFDFFDLFELLKSFKSEIRLVVIEAGWLNKSVWQYHPRANSKIAARVGKDVGANHEAGRKIEEMCKYLEIDCELVRPTQSKLSAKEFVKITGIQERTNQEQRDAFMLVFGR